jgi:hypothetical protein
VKGDEDLISLVRGLNEASEKSIMSLQPPAFVSHGSLDLQGEFTTPMEARPAQAYIMVKLGLLIF